MSVKEYGRVRVNLNGRSRIIVTRQGRIMDFVKEIHFKGFTTKQPLYIGMLEHDLIEYAKSKGIEIASSRMYMNGKKTGHTVRDLHQERGIDISDEQLATFPSRRRKMAVYHDSDDNSFVYFDGEAKYVFRTNYQIKKKGLDNKRIKMKVVGLITAYKAKASDFNHRNYTLIRNPTE